jgi:hypothetical protein
VASPDKWPLAVGGFALAFAVVVFFHRGSSANLSGDLLVSPRLGMAFAPPSGWTLQSRPDGLRWTNGPAGLQFSTRRGENSQAALDVFNGADANAQAPEPAVLAGRAAMRWRVKGGRAVLPGAAQSVEWDGWVVAFSEGSLVYSVAAWSERGDFAKRSAELEKALSSVVLTSN